MNKAALLALARKALDPASPDAERATSAQMLAKEILKLLEDPSTVLIQNSAAVQELSEIERQAAAHVDKTVRQAVAVDEVKTRVEDGGSPVTWVDFDPPPSSPSPGPSPFQNNAFGRKPRRPR